MDDDKALTRAHCRALVNYVNTLKGRGYDMTEIALDLGVSEEQVRDFHRDALEWLHAEKVDVASELRKIGYNNKGIAKHMGISERQVLVLIGIDEEGK